MYTNPNVFFLFTAECCPGLMLAGYNITVICFYNVPRYLYYSIISGNNVTIMLRANEDSVFFNQSYLKKEYTLKPLGI